MVVHNAFWDDFLPIAFRLFSLELYLDIFGHRILHRKLGSGGTPHTPPKNFRKKKDANGAFSYHFSLSRSAFSLEFYLGIFGHKSAMNREFPFIVTWDVAKQFSRASWRRKAASLPEMFWERGWKWCFLGPLSADFVLVLSCYFLWDYHQSPHMEVKLKWFGRFGLYIQRWCVFKRVSGMGISLVCFKDFLKWKRGIIVC